MQVAAALRAYQPRLVPASAPARESAPAQYGKPCPQGDCADISKAGRQALAAEEKDKGTAETEENKENRNNPNREPDRTKGEDKVNGRLLEADDLRELKELKARDREVRAHEQAHQSVGGAHAGSPSYTYQAGPDGGRYAVAGEVPIDVGKEASPEQTIAKMERVRRAALAPAEPSSADRNIAAQAASTLAVARQELAQANHDQGKDQESEQNVITNKYADTHHTSDNQQQDDAQRQSVDVSA